MVTLSESTLREAEYPVAGMADEIRRRIELPLDQWSPWDGQAMAERVKARLREKHGLK